MCVNIVEVTQIQNMLKLEFLFRLLGLIFKPTVYNKQWVMQIIFDRSNAHYFHFLLLLYNIDSLYMKLSIPIFDIWYQFETKFENCRELDSQQL